MKSILTNTSLFADMRNFSLLLLLLLYFTNKFTIFHLFEWILHFVLLADGTARKRKRRVLCLLIVLLFSFVHIHTRLSMNTQCHIHRLITFLFLVINDKHRHSYVIFLFHQHFHFNILHSVFSSSIFFHCLLSLSVHVSVSGGYTIKYPIKFFCIFFYNLMRVFMCAHDFFFATRKKIIQKK